MENNLDILLSLGDIDSISKLKTRVYEEELKEINAKKPLEENKIDIFKTYFVKNENTLEVGFFIRNGLTQNLSLEEMPLAIIDEKGNEILSQSFNFKEYGIIPGLSARPFAVNFEMTDGTCFNEKEEHSLKFSALDNLSAFPSVPTEIENMPTNLIFEEEKALRDFANALPTLKENEFTISVYNVTYTPAGGINCSLILRNGKNEEASLEKLPISVVNEEGMTIARNIFEDKEGIVKISPKKSKFINFEFKSTDVMPGRYDLAKCRVMYT